MRILLLAVRKAAGIASSHLKKPAAAAQQKADCRSRHQARIMPDAQAGKSARFAAAVKAGAFQTGRQSKFGPGPKQPLVQFRPVRARLAKAYLLTRL